MKNQLAHVLEVLHLAEKLKYEMRHSWLSNGRQESVAEHTWRMSLMAVLLEPYLDQEVDTARMLKMIIIHDLVEAEAGDIPAFLVVDDTSKALKAQKELEAIENLRQKLGTGTGQHIYELWHEFEARETYEAKVANALDKLEVQIQHNHADISTWLDVEHEYAYRMGQHTGFDSCLELFKELIEQQATEKMLQAGIDCEAVKVNLNKKLNIMPGLN